jgi:phosphoribosylanthranilate isomerase
MTWIKICGTTNLHDARISIEAGADALGFIFAPSPRRIGISEAGEIIAQLPNGIEKIGVFVNEAPARVAQIVDLAGLTGVQLHGDEPAEQLHELRQRLGDKKTIKGIQFSEIAIDQKDILEGFLAARGSLDAILLDSGSAQQRGGTGIPFSWNDALDVAATIRKALPLVIAGGLNPGNVELALELFQPWGLDVVSGVESGPGKKDEAKLRNFVAAIRATQASARQRE